MKMYSANMFDIFENCAFKYYFKYIRKINIPQFNINADLGQNIHNLINIYFKTNDKKQVENIAKNYDEKTQKLFNDFFKLKIENVIKSEWSFNYRFEADENNIFLLTGRIDAISKQNNKIVIYDWKTGKSNNINPTEDFQTAIYLLTVYKYYSEQYGLNYDDFSMNYVFLNDNMKIETVKFTKELYIKYIEKIKSTLIKMNKIGNNTFEHLQNTRKCDFCEYKELCKHCV